MESKPLNNQINDDKNVEGKNGEENKENFQKDKYKKKGEYPNFLSTFYFYKYTILLIILYIKKIKIISNFRK